MGYALHQTAIAQKDPCMVVDDSVAVAVELGSEGFLCQRHPDGIRDALPQRPGRRLDARGIAKFRVAGRLAWSCRNCFKSSMESSYPVRGKRA
ncbi:MAG: hypothetical protein CM15mP25_2430 [Gammaproteobacteria bacterium]|nr:MAG: hypothetical protein CM15mP25_2430 [Gammaproteobacteria bacterium]